MKANEVLFIKDWLKFSDPDPEGFASHIAILYEDNTILEYGDIIQLAKAYNLDLASDKESDTYTLNQLKKIFEED